MTFSTDERDYLFDLQGFLVLDDALDKAQLTDINRWIDRQMRGTAWEVSNNYYKAPTGRIVTQWPFGPLLYGILTKTLAPLSERTRVAVGSRQPVRVA